MSDCAMSETPIPLIYESLEPTKKPKDNLLNILDQVEAHVERIRKEACRLEEEKDVLLTTLDTIKNSQLLEDLTLSDREDIDRYTERISLRCSTVEVNVVTSRDQTQIESLHHVNKLIDSLILGLREDPPGTKTRCISFMNSCTSQCIDGHVDKMFENAILGCTIDDQKRVKRRLSGLMEYIEKSSVTF